MPVTSTEVRSIALDERIPVDDTCAMPVERLLIWTLPALVITNFVAPLLLAVKRSPTPLLSTTNPAKEVLAAIVANGVVPPPPVIEKEPLLICRGRPLVE